MSSIYRKGRDGYYYYQTYIYNKDTGKKDKRIFHSLATRELSQAEEKQSELDKKYEKQTKRFPKKSLFEFIGTQKRSILLVMITSITTVFIMNSFQKSSIQKDKNIVKAKPANIKKNSKTSRIKKEKKLKEKISDKTMLNNSKTKTNSIIPKKVLKQKLPKPSIPKYNLVRLDRLSGAFDQVKIFITVSNNNSSKGLELLCKKLAKKYNEFSNIVICIYDSSPAGIELANGIDSNHNKEERKKAWLAMYSYNPVEGDYFDDNPGGYLGAY